MEKYDIFISYSSKDEFPVDLCDKLEKEGLKCWIAPRDIIPGAPYARSIMQGLGGTTAVLVFISSDSLESEDVLNEIDNAHSLKKTIIPIFIEDVPLTPEFSYYLKRKQWINAYNNPGSVVNQICKALGYTPGKRETASVERHENQNVKSADKAKYSVYLADVGSSKLEVVKRLMDVFHINLKQAKSLADNSEFGIVFLTIVDSIKRFETLKEWFADVGATLTYKSAGKVTDKVSYEIHDPDEVEYEVYLTNPGLSKLSVVKLVKDKFGLTLGRAKELVDNSRFGRVLLKVVGTYKEFAEIQRSFQEVGAVVAYKRKIEKK